MMTDWSALGLSHDPAPGDPNVVRDGGEQFTSTADALARAASIIRGLNGGVSHDALSVKALMDQAGDLDRDLSQAEGRYRVAGTVLTGYAMVLSRVQGSTHSALMTAQRKRSDAAADRRLAAKWRQMAQQSTDDVERAEYERAEARFLQAAADHDRAVAIQRQLVTGWSQELDQAANQAARVIEDAQIADGLDDTWWENWGSKFFNILAEVAEMIAMIAGLLALLFVWLPPLAGLLLTISAIASVIAAIANIVLAAKGEKTWGQAIGSIVMAVLSCVGAGAAKALGKAVFRVFMEAGAEAAKARYALSAVGKLGSRLGKWLLPKGAWARILAGNNPSLVTQRIGQECVNIISGATKPGASAGAIARIRAMKVFNRFRIGGSNNVGWGKPGGGRLKPGQVARIENSLPGPGRLNWATNSKSFDRIAEQLTKAKIIHRVNVVTYGEVLGWKMSAWVQGTAGTAASVALWVHGRLRG